MRFLVCSLVITYATLFPPSCSVNTVAVENENLTFQQRVEDFNNNLIPELPENHFPPPK